MSGLNRNVMPCCKEIQAAIEMRLEEVALLSLLPMLEPLPFSVLAKIVQFFPIMPPYRHCNDDGHHLEWPESC